MLNWSIDMKRIVASILIVSLFCQPVHAILPAVVVAGEIAAALSGTVGALMTANTALEMIFMPDEAARQERNRLEEQRRTMSIQGAYLQRVWGGYISDTDLITSARNNLDLATKAVSNACNRYNLDCGKLIPSNVYFSSLPNSRLSFIDRKYVASIGLVRETSQRSLTYEISADTLMADDPASAMTEELADLLFFYFDDQKSLLQSLKESAYEVLFKNSSALRPSIERLAMQQGLRLGVNEFKWSKIADTFKAWTLNELKQLRRNEQMPLTLKWTNSFVSLNDEANRMNKMSKPLRMENTYVTKFLPKLQRTMAMNNIMSDVGTADNIKDFTLSVRTLNLKDFDSSLPNQYFPVQCEPYTPVEGYLTGTMSRLFVNLPPCQSVTLENVLENGRKSIGKDRAKLYQTAHNQSWVPTSATSIVGGLIGAIVTYIAFKRIGITRLVPAMKIAGDGATNSVKGGLLEGSLPALAASSRAVHLTRLGAAGLNALNFVAINGISVGFAGAQYMLFPWGRYQIEVKFAEDFEVNKMREYFYYLQSRLDEAYNGALDAENFKREVLIEGQKYGITDINFYEQVPVKK